MLIGMSATKKMYSQRRSIMRSKNVGTKGIGLSPVQREDEHNLLSYLVRKYPKEAMNHLSAEDMRAELAVRGVDFLSVKVMDDQRIAAEAVKRGLRKIVEA